MICLIPSVKSLKIENGFLKKKAISTNCTMCDRRLEIALSKLPQDVTGTLIDIEIADNTGEGYEIWIEKDEICIKASSKAGAFYAIQTLRQIFEHDEVPCLYIKDEPDFAYRGFYQDITRGKVPTVQTIKQLIDRMAYYKLNSLQLYVEHTFEFEEYKDINESMGYLTAEEIKEIDAYCVENFIDFIPSLSTFGHLYELLEQDKYKHLRVFKDYKTDPNFWAGRMAHHTLDPRNEESIQLVKSLIDQYAPLFSSNSFNICCDETFDLKILENEGYDSGSLYVDFVKQIIEHVKHQGKQVMMWADILLQHPEVIEEIAEDVCFLNWDYGRYPSEEQVMALAKLGRKQIVCPGTTTWSRWCENVGLEETNISLLIEYGYKHGAYGVLNTNWGDWANPCSLELAMYGMVLGAAKSWSVGTEINDVFHQAVNKHLYKNANGVSNLKELSAMHELVDWDWLVVCRLYFAQHFENADNEKCQAILNDVKIDLAKVQEAYKTIAERLADEKWENDEYRQEMLLTAKGICAIAEILISEKGDKVIRLIDIQEWIYQYSQNWMKKNKYSELKKIEEVFMFFAAKQ